MKTEDLRRLAERAEGVEGRSGERLAEVHARIRTTRRKRAGAGVAAAAALIAAVVAGGATLTSVERTQDPVDKPTPTPTPTVEIPDGQRTVVADIGPGDIGALTSWPVEPTPSRATRAPPT